MLIVWFRPFAHFELDTRNRLLNSLLRTVRLFWARHQKGATLHTYYIPIFACFVLRAHLELLVDFGQYSSFELLTGFQLFVNFGLFSKFDLVTSVSLFADLDYLSLTDVSSPFWLDWV